MCPSICILYLLSIKSSSSLLLLFMFLSFAAAVFGGDAGLPFCSVMFLDDVDLGGDAGFLTFCSVVFLEEEIRAGEGRGADARGGACCVVCCGCFSVVFSCFVLLLGSLLFLDIFVSDAILLPLLL